MQPRADSVARGLQTPKEPPRSKCSQRFSSCGSPRRPLTPLRAGRGLFHSQSTQVKRAGFGCRRVGYPTDRAWRRYLGLGAARLKMGRLELLWREGLKSQGTIDYEPTARLHVLRLQ